MAHDTVRPAGVAAALAAAALALTALAPPAPLPAAVRTGAAADDGGTALLAAVVGVACWAVLGWLALALTAASAARMPGAAGRTGAWIADRVSPALLRRAVGGGAALTLALAPALLPAAAGAAPGPGAAGACATAGALPGLDRTASPCAIVLAGLPADPTTEASAAPATLATAPPTRAAVPPSPTPPASATGLVPRPGATSPYVVRPGDTLWSLARAELEAAGRPATPAAVAARWPVWWQANRAAIGADPDLIRPGTDLRPPA